MIFRIGLAGAAGVACFGLAFDTAAEFLSDTSAVDFPFAVFFPGKVIEAFSVSFDAFTGFADDAFTGFADYAFTVVF